MGVEFSSVRKLAQQFGTLPMDTRRELRPRMRAAGELVRRDLQGSYSAWSTRIPGAVRLTTSFGSKTGGVRIFVDAGRAPHARPIENEGAEGTFRHPLWGTDVWVEQEARPTFFPTIKSHRETVITMVREAVRAAFPKGV